MMSPPSENPMKLTLLNLSANCYSAMNYRTSLPRRYPIADKSPSVLPSLLPECMKMAAG